MISLDNPVYQFWKILVVVICIVSSYVYASIAAFKIPSVGSGSYYLIMIFDGIFVVEATALPIKDDRMSVVFNGGSLMPDSSVKNNPSM